ncbi:fungal-specific transcription factor domain-containing protein [Dactylonectria macrodidyma]|uniref:Fungal-specific transcription factor domain-containing protein n=1 Tax=Dactylonectria macrodidyma TaxID=307937 RepID=A0A9P9J4W0_9HYPO|nr:fungal-specific transcription factor domain-containing protein [Dactylonectria macrodidyma]
METPSHGGDTEEGPLAAENGLQDEPRSKRRRLAEKEEAAGPSCHSCRRRKAKCSRDQPCSSCLKLGIDCVYDQEKSKPGMRTGAIESLNQRVAALENMFVGQGVLWQQIWNSISHHGGQGSDASPSSNQPPSIQQQSSAVREYFAALSSSKNPPQLGSRESSLSKDAVRTPVSGNLPQQDPTSTKYGDQHLPPDSVVDSLVETYFTQVHPWIPILHAQKFRARLSHPLERARVSTILHAIVSLCIRFSDDPQIESSPHVRSWYSTRCRQTVILQSMESFSVENLQALIICAFDTIGSGRGPSAWSIVGSMTRTVEQLRLSTEDDENQSQSSTCKALFKRMAFLPPSSTWIEVEERRRVFWNVFLMDRFCSVSTGWNLSLTSADVKRRLPCEGAMWEAGEPIGTPTPYFGLAHQSADRDSDCLPVVRGTEDGQASLGGFAFCIEATESLSLVTSFFLQYEVDFKQVHEVQRWLMRFKQLDLRLVQWKFFLPEKWREACVVNDDGNLDPNLVLAHMTHNTAVVLLHQGLAYPSPEWQSVPVRLPSASSAETCQAAAVEVATIAAQFLRSSGILTNPQFAFCLFVCGRMLLAHAAYYKSLLPSAFDSIIMSLEDIARRWNGSQSPAVSNLASKFGSRLVQSHIHGANPVDLREEAFSETQNAITSSTTNVGFNNMGFRPIQGGVSPMPPLLPTGTLIEDLNLQGPHIESPESITLAFPPLPMSFELDKITRDSNFSSQPNQGVLPDEQNLGDTEAIENCLDFYGLSDQSFIPSDRVSMLSRSYADG